MYAAEEVRAGNMKFHKRCFTCNNKPSCNKSLSSGSYNDNGGRLSAYAAIRSVAKEEFNNFSCSS